MTSELLAEHTMGKSKSIYIAVNKALCNLRIAVIMKLKTITIIVEKLKSGILKLL